MVRTLMAVMAALWLCMAPAAAADEAAKQQIAEAISALIEAFETRDADRIRAMMTSDHVAISPNYGRPYSVDEQIETLPQLDFNVTGIGERQISMVGDDAALVTQRVSVEGSFRGRRLPADIFVSQLWIREDGRWLQRLYQETAVDP